MSIRPLVKKFDEIICDHILELIAQKHQVEIFDIISMKMKTHQMSRIRWEAWWLASKYTSFSRYALANIFSCDASSIYHGNQKIEEARKDKKFSFEMENIQTKILHFIQTNFPQFKKSYIGSNQKIERSFDQYVKYQLKATRHENIKYWAEKKKEHLQTKRKCLHCQKEFGAIGKFNRICEHCKSSANFYDGFNDTTVSL
tara:strand:+ start:2595 stop:3194 length:600 start_codon:yes stop_codon:yes gene_type:complete